MHSVSHMESSEEENCWTTVCWCLWTPFFLDVSLQWLLHSFKSLPSLSPQHRLLFYTHFFPLVNLPNLYSYHCKALLVREPFPFRRGVKNHPFSFLRIYLCQLSVLLLSLSSEFLSFSRSILHFFKRTSPMTFVFLHLSSASLAHLNQHSQNKLHVSSPPFLSSHFPKLRIFAFSVTSATASSPIRQSS